MSDLKAFFSEKEINITNIVDCIKQAKRNDDPKAYWQLYYLVFLAFFIDHS